MPPVNTGLLEGHLAWRQHHPDLKALPFPMLAPYFLSAGGDPGLVAFLGIHPKLLLGMLLAVYPLGILVGSSFLGAFSDHFGRKRVLVVTLCLGGAG
jgi:MFS family permease